MLVFINKFKNFMRPGEFYRSVFFLVLLAAAIVHPQKKIIIKAEVTNLPADSHVYITGNNDELGNWNFMREMKNESAEKWSYFVSVRSGDTLQFKFTRGSRDSEAVDSNGVEFPNFVWVVKKDTTLAYKFSNWRDEAQHKIFITPENWRGDALQEDDITFVVVKME